MALSTSVLSAAIKAECLARPETGMVASDALDALCDAIATAVVEHIVAAAVVTGTCTGTAGGDPIVGGACTGGIT